jgi:hypothetical protein
LRGNVDSVSRSVGVIPAQAGIHLVGNTRLDSRLRGKDTVTGAIAAPPVR